MSHIFGPEFDEKTQGILESLKTVSEAASIMMENARKDDHKTFEDIGSVLLSLIESILESSVPYKKIFSSITLTLRCQALLLSMRAILKYDWENIGKILNRIEFEFIPIAEQAYCEFYYQAYVKTYPERENNYFNKEICELASNKYTNRAIETGNYKYDVSICVIAYNKLDFTKRCVDHVLKNMPEDLKCELILWDNGSTDGTLKYFESINPTKVIESWVNWGAAGAIYRISEARVFVHVSNDVIVSENAISNIARCIIDDERVGKVVPVTPNVSNLQASPVSYNNINEFEAFTLSNNIYDSFRHEERTRLCDPIAAWNCAANFSKYGVCPNGYVISNTTFPDDMQSLLLRRKGYKMILAKDAYCHHYGSVTIKEEIAKKDMNEVYLKGRKSFHNEFGIDPWGTGFCYNISFLDRVVGDDVGHKDILGINCGMGSNSLKIKEQIKEYCHNTDCSLYNITDDERYLPDLNGISDYASMITSNTELKSFLDNKTFDYIVIDDPFLKKRPFDTVINIILDHLGDNGTLFMKIFDGAVPWVKKNANSTSAMKEGWIRFDKQVRR